MTPDNMPPVPPQRFDVGACPVLVAGCVCSRRRGSSNFGSGQSVSLLERPCRTQAEATAPCCAEAYRRNSITVVAAVNRPAVQSGDGVPEPQKPQSQDRHPARLLGEGIERALPASSIQIPLPSPASPSCELADRWADGPLSACNRNASRPQPAAATIASNVARRRRRAHPPSQLRDDVPLGPAA